MEIPVDTLEMRQRLYEIIVRHSTPEFMDDGKVCIMLSDDRGMIISREEYDRIMEAGSKAKEGKNEQSR